VANASLQSHGLLGSVRFFSAVQWNAVLENLDCGQMSMQLGFIRIKNNHK